ncbi:MAG: dTDP-4-dehydrorhamnose 3,5-epimerase [Xanthomonadales bacterium]|nr:dTDP-4-dehydrorhamnose 3,5-epimerase [Xanthomonadales bacterium]
MRIRRLSLPELALLEPDWHEDLRGGFMELWQAERFAAAGLEFPVAQLNLSRSRRGVIRGLHYQWPEPQGKLVACLEGEIFDVAVDIRRGSPRFGQHAAAMLTADNRRMLWIPPGFAHGFAVVSERALVIYACSAPYRREADRVIRYDDPALAIDWPVGEPILSAKDREAPRLAELAEEALPGFA